MSIDTDQTDAGDSRRPHARRERAVVLFADPAGSIIRAGDEVPDEESLPVLTAFRQFLEAERRRARRQMAALIAACLLAMIALAGGGVWYLRTALIRVKNDAEADKVRNEEFRLAAVSNLQGVARAASALGQDVRDARYTSRILQERVTAQNDALSKLLDTITTLEIQNSMMQRALRKLDQPRPPPPDMPELEPREEPEPPLPGPEARVTLAAPPPRAEPLWRAAPPPPPETVPETETVAPGEPLVFPPPAASASGTTPGGVPYRLPLPRD